MTTTLKVDETISLELINDKHAESVFELVNKNRIEFREWLPWVDNANTVAFIKNFIEGAKRKAIEETDFSYVILLNDIVVGRIGVYKINRQDKIGEIGYWIGSDFTGKGIVTKACKALISYCFDTHGLNRIEIKCGSENYKSQRIPELLGFKKEGIIRHGEFLFNKSKFIDLSNYAMIKEEWAVNNH